MKRQKSDDRSQTTEVRGQRSEGRRKAGRMARRGERRSPGSGSWRTASIVLVSILSAVLFSLPVFADEKWTGVDESVVEKYAKEHGREAHEPLINTDQGDLLLFVFLLGGVVGGFVAGYSWRMLMVEKPQMLAREKKQ